MAETPRAAMRVLRVTGAVEYMRAWEVQQRLAQLLAAAASAGQRPVHSVILLQHSPVYTVGLRSAAYSKEEEARLRSTGAQFVRSNRGGLITFHGPGQLTVYVCALERTVIRTCRTFGISAFTTPDTGVWVSDSAKICALGIHGRRVTTHGLALNCNTDLTWFTKIVPCGLTGKTVTSMSHELGRDVTVNEVETPFLRAFSEVFECNFVEEKTYTAQQFEKLADECDINNQEDGSQ
ncbi:hypothetical protein HAZT_HAZT000798 [Hyalella azteca]|uniref:Octanoyl-[acyl-carrier-protein]:protein N-octanoyltransferase LIPT2, mitochondrial n=1 Tax=Hyalella azteca TaxID=294128 RepID=A0A6A0GS11_HYAAZ|nr:hypothetical protein HAZT_HAZT000798 [Hyalella azteca]